jgi:hypothetical protein
MAHHRQLRTTFAPYFCDKQQRSNMRESKQANKYGHPTQPLYARLSKLFVLTTPRHCLMQLHVAQSCKIPAVPLAKLPAEMDRAAASHVAALEVSCCTHGMTQCCAAASVHRRSTMFDRQLCCATYAVFFNQRGAYMQRFTCKCCISPFFPKCTPPADPSECKLLQCNATCA